MFTLLIDMHILTGFVVSRVYTEADTKFPKSPHAWYFAPERDKIIKINAEQNSNVRLREITRKEVDI